MTVVEMATIAGAAGQVFVAAIASYLAFQANRINKGSIFVSRLVSDLLACRASAARVRELYCGLFNDFPDADAKRVAKNTWVRERDALSREIYFLADAFPEVEA